MRWMLGPQQLCIGVSKRTRRGCGSGSWSTSLWLRGGPELLRKLWWRGPSRGPPCVPPSRGARPPGGS